MLAASAKAGASLVVSVTCDPSRRPLHSLHPGLAQPGLAASARLVRRGQAGRVHALPLQRARNRQRGGSTGGGGITLYLSSVPLTSQSAREFRDDAAVGLCILKCACIIEGGEGKTPILVFLKHFFIHCHCIPNL